MSVIQEWFSQTPPDRLYHYTSQKGLIGIAQDGAIWASKIHYLNDSQEFRLALSIAKNRLESMRFSPKYKTRFGQKIDEMLHELETIATINVCVASFSERNDQLSQWRGYASFGSGYSIGFNTTQLINIASQSYPHFSLLKCSYSKSRNERMIKELIDITLKYDPRQTDTRNDYLEYLHPRLGFETNIITLAAFIKHSSFLEECEWRLVSNPVPSYNLNFRQGHSMLIPYCICPHSNTETKLKIEEVIVGPCPNMDEAEGAAKMLLMKTTGQTTLTPNTVRRSSIPFRNW